MIPKFVIDSTDSKISYALLYNEEITPNYLLFSILIISKVFNVLHGLAHYFGRQRFEVHGYLIIRYSVKNNILSKGRKMFLPKTSSFSERIQQTCILWHLQALSWIEQQPDSESAGSITSIQTICEDYQVVPCLGVSPQNFVAH